MCFTHFRYIQILFTTFTRQKIQITSRNPTTNNASNPVGTHIHVKNSTPHSNKKITQTPNKNPQQKRFRRAHNASEPLNTKQPPGYDGIWPNTWRRTHACIAIPAAVAAFIERVDPNCSIDRVSLAAACNSSDKPGPS